MTRRRGDELDTAIRTAVLRLLAEQGPAGVTMEAVAAEARTSKPVLYRRWPDRTSLLRDTLLQIATAAIPHADAGSYRADMLAILRGWAALFTGGNAPVLRAAIAAGSIWMRTAYFWLPKIRTCATPSTVERAGEMTCCAKASSCESGTMSLFSASRMIGAAAGLTFR